MDQVIALEEKAIRLRPRDPIIATWYFDLGALHLLQSRTGEAIVWIGKERNAYPGYSFVYRWLAAAYGLQGDSTRAAEELAETRRLSRISSSMARLNAKRSQQWLQGPTIRSMAEATYFAGLRKAGMPEE
jgi:predicted Zn-dependent protease